MLQERMREYQRDLHLVFVDLKKAYDTVPKDFIWYCLRRRQVPEENIRLMKDRQGYLWNCSASVNSCVRSTEGMRIVLVYTPPGAELLEIGHQASHSQILKAHPTLFAFLSKHPTGACITNISACNSRNKPLDNIRK